ncbi:hypothetical protein D3C71_411270 [compost metagenome]
MSTWLLPLNTMPLRLATITVPSALICPWICEGRACGSFTLLSTAQSLRCAKATVVLRPTLKVSQFRIALSAVCSTVTTVRPSTCRCESPVSARAFDQPAVSEFVSTFRPPSARPSGTEGSFCAARRAAACAACCAAMPRAARFRLPMDCCSCSLARCCCASGLVSCAAGDPLGIRPVAVAVACAAPLALNQVGLKARCACAGAAAAPAASASAMACASGEIRKLLACTAAPWRRLRCPSCVFI